MEYQSTIRRPVSIEGLGLHSGQMIRLTVSPAGSDTGILMRAADGTLIGFRFPAAAYDEVVAFVGNERKCCPALTFELTIEPGAEAIQLRLTGPDGAREFIAAELPIDKGPKSRGCAASEGAGRCC